MSKRAAPRLTAALYRETPPHAETSFGVDRFRLATTAYLCLAALWVATRPYPGIIHDARLYAVQALHRLDPPRFAQDLYFAFGSQDSLTLFSACYAPLVGYLGPATAHGLATLIGALCWVPALLWLTRGLFGAARPALPAAAAVIVLSPYYGALGVFSYGEPFATPRLFAESFVMVALAAAVRGRPWPATVALAGAGAFHPLMTLPGMAVVAVLLLPRHRGLWLIGAVIAVGGGTLALLGVEPFSRALLRFDAAWLEMIRLRSPQALLLNWDWCSLAASTLPLVALVIALQIGSAAERRVVRATLGVAAIGLVLTFLGGDLAHNVLVANLQPWRALWLLTLVGNAWAGVLVLRLATGSRGREFFLIALVCNLIERWLDFPPFCSAAIAAVALLAFLYEQGTGRELALLLRLAGKAITTTAILMLGLILWTVIPIRMAPVGPLGPAVSAVVTLAGLALLMPDAPGLRRTRRGSAMLAGVLLLACVAVVDRRTGWTRFIEAGSLPEELTALLADTRTVYWEKGVELLWFGLRRPDFYACTAGAGLMFFRATAQEFRRRSEALHHLDTADFGPDAGAQCYPKALPDEHGPSRRAQLVSVCAALPELDLLVLTRDVPDVPSRVWHAPISLPLGEGAVRRYHDRFHFYRCADLR